MAGMASRACSIRTELCCEWPSTFRPMNTVRPSPASARLTSAR